MVRTKRIIVLITIIALLFGAVALTACNNGDDPNKTVKYSFNISKTEMSLEVGESEKLECHYGDKKIVFVSSDTAIATVSEDGTVSAVAEGVAYVTAKADGVDDAEKICKITVTKSVYTVSLGKEEKINAITGASIEFNAIVYKNGVKTALVANFTVSPADSVVADNNVARVTFSRAGEYVVKAEYRGAVASVTVTVTDAIA